jgi:Domain of unknown function (DUF1772)
MVSVVIDFANMLLVALLVGSMFAVWLIFNPAGLEADLYVALQQQAIRTLNTILPAMGAASIAATVAAAVAGRTDTPRLGMLIVAAACLVASGIVTRFLNQPINAIVMTWSNGAPPNWTSLRDAWWRWHLLRLGFGLAGLSLVTAAMLRRAWPS